MFVFALRGPVQTLFSTSRDLGNHEDQVTEETEYEMGIRFRPTAQVDPQWLSRSGANILGEIIYIKDDEVAEVLRILQSLSLASSDKCRPESTYVCTMASKTTTCNCELIHCQVSVSTLKHSASQ